MIRIGKSASFQLTHYLSLERFTIAYYSSSHRLSFSLFVSTYARTRHLCGCWQFIAVWRDRHYLRKGKVIKQEQEYSYYVTSLACAESTQGQIAQIIRGHWNAVENGSHYRRDVTLGEDASLISGRAGAHVMATLRNLVLGLFELQKHGGKTDGYVPGWQRKMRGSNALTLIKAKN